MSALRYRSLIGLAALACLFAFADPAPSLEGELCMGDNGGTGVNVSYNCKSIPVFNPNEWTGFTTSGQPCRTSDYVCIIPAGRNGFTEFGWSITDDPTDPMSNLGILPGDSGRLYLWYYCGWSYGLLTAEFYLEGSLAQHITAFEPRNGFTNAGSNTHLMLSVDGCPTVQVIAGEIILGDPTAIDGSSWGRVKATYR
jgi:hypothetical protein